MKKCLLLLVLALAMLPAVACSETLKDYNVIGSEVLLETLTGLFGGGDVEDIVNILGKPLRKTRYYHGEFVRWKFGKGVEADIVYENDYPSLYNYLYLSPRSPLKTRRRIGIGSPAASVYRKYAGAINPDQSSDLIIVAGTTGIGVIFILQDDAVHAIYLAPGAFTRHGATLERD